MIHTNRPKRLAMVGAGFGAAIMALAVIGPAAILALVSDGGTYDIKVADRSGHAVATTTAGSIVEYIGDQNETFGSSGTGVFDSFVRVQEDGSESGYNTDGTLEFNSKAGKWTHAIKVSDIPVISSGGIPYWELFSDINESNSTPLISLNKLEVYFADSATVTGYPSFGGHATEQYAFDGAFLIRDVNQGSGRGDLRYRIPLTNITIPANCGYKDPLCNTWFVLYSQWGTTAGYTTDGGFEEWKVKQYPYVTVAKTAATTYTRKYAWDITKDVDKTLVKVAEGGTATFNYTVKVHHDAGTDSAWAVNGSITITNPGSSTAVITSVADVVSGAGAGAATVTCPVTFPYSLLKGATLTCTYAKALPDAATRSNVATVMLDYGGTFTGSTPVVFTAPTTVTDECVNVVDSLYGTLGTACVGQANPKTFTYAMTFPGVAGTCTDYNNTATFTTNDTATTGSASKKVTVCVGENLKAGKTAAGTFDRTYLWKIEKDVDKTSVNIAEGGSYTFNYTVDVSQTGFTDSGWELSGHVYLQNVNDWEDITLTTLTDTVDNGGTCAITESAPYVVPKGGAITTFHYTCTWAAQPTTYTGKNLVTATWDAAAYFTPRGDVSAWVSFTLTQDGATNKTIHVTDSYAGALGTVTATDALPYATASFPYTRTESGVAGTCTKYDNTATITETEQTADQEVTLCVGKDLTVTKDAAVTYTRTYAWQITKAVDKTTADIVKGASATFNYTVQVSHNAGTDSAWKAAGTITITNPNDWEAITLTGLTDVVNNGGSCSVDAGPYVVAKSGHIHVGYTCTYASAPSPLAGTNTATATWDKALAFTPNGSASGSAAASFTGAPTTVVDECVNVTDTFAGFLGTVCVGDANPTSFTYSRVVTPAVYGNACGTFTYDNTATFTTNDTATKGSASKTVTVNVLCLEGCTPGYWKNHLDSWVGYSPTQTVEDVFNVPNAFGLDNDTLLMALAYEGGTGDVGAAQILLRTGVAALLNAANGDVAYPLSTSQVISMVNTALAGHRDDMLALASTLDGYNNLGCPLN